MRWRGKLRFFTASSQPAEVDIVIPDCLRVDEEENFLCLCIATCRCLGLCIVEVEYIIIEVIALGDERGRR